MIKKLFGINKKIIDKGIYKMTYDSKSPAKEDNLIKIRFDDKNYDPALNKILSNGDIQTTSTLETTSPTVGSIVTAGGVGIGKALRIASTTASTTTATGSIITAGGVGIAGAVNVGGNITTSTGTITGNIVIGAVYNS